MPEVAVVTDSLACIPAEMAKQYGISIVSLNIHHGGKVYKDWVDITPSQAYELFLQGTGAWGSSAPSPGDFLDAYRRQLEKVDDIVCITASAKLSATYDVANIAKLQAEGEYPDRHINVLDSETVTASEGMVALAAAQTAAEGGDLAEVIRRSEDIRDRVRLIAVMDTVRYAYRSGRFPRIATKLGSILNIKPIFTVAAGVVRTVGLTRSREQALTRIVIRLREEVGKSPVHMAVMHAYAPAEAEKLRAKLDAEFDCRELWITEFSPVMGYTCGTGTLGIAYYEDDN